MRFYSRIMALSVFPGCLLLMLAILCFGEELIAPTRTLKEGGQAWGRLAVFSEPPELDVLINEEKVGRTPLWLDKIKAGFYVLKVGGKQTEITVSENGYLKIGLFRGTFIALPEDEKEINKPTVAEKSRDQAQKVTVDPDAQKARDLTMWEVLIGGSSIQLWDSKK